jgi:DNA-binding beta-propeller fold protein YncE
MHPIGTWWAPARARGWSRLAVVAVVVGAAMAPMGASAATPSPPVFLKTLAGPGAAHIYSGGLSYDAVNNRLVTADTGLDKVEFYSLTGTKLPGDFGSYGAAPGRFNEPRDIAIDPNANIYVADSVNNRVQKFDSTGKQPAGCTCWVRIANPLGLSWDFQNNVLLVVSTPNSVVEAFDAGLVSKWTSPSPGVTGLLNPRDATRGPDRRIWVADYGHQQIKAFDVSPSGQWSTPAAIVLGRNGTGLGQLNSPYNVDFSPDGKTAYVADTGNERVARWDLTKSPPNPLPQFGSRCLAMPCGPGQIEGLRRVVAVPNGTVYADDLWGNGIDYFAPDSNGAALGEIEGTGIARAPASGFAQAFGVAVAQDGTTYGVDRINQRIERFSANGTFLNSSGARGTGPSDESWPESVAVAPNATVWVADTRNNRLQVWPADLCQSGCVPTIVGSGGSGNGQFNYPRGVASDALGNVWVADTRNNRIVRYTPSTKTFVSFGSQGTGQVQFNRPQGLAVSSSAIYVADTGNMRIEELGLDGHYINSYTGGLGGVQDIAIAPDGTLWVADSGHNRIVHVSADLTTTYPDTFGSFGSGSMQFYQPHSLAIFGTTLFIADTFNNRIQEFTITLV